MVYHYQYGALLNPVEAQAYEKQAAAARAMLAALKDLYEFDELCWKVSQQAYDAGRAAIAQAEAAGITLAPT